MYIYKLSFILVMLQEDGVTRGEEQDEVIESLDDKGQVSLETTRYVGQVGEFEKTLLYKTRIFKIQIQIQIQILILMQKTSARRRKAVVTEVTTALVLHHVLSKLLELHGLEGLI